MVDRYLSRAWPPRTVRGSRRPGWLRLRTVVSLCPRSRQYDPVLTLPASLRDSVLAVPYIKEILTNHLRFSTLHPQAPMLDVDTVWIRSRNSRSQRQFFWGIPAIGLTSAWGKAQCPCSNPPKTDARPLAIRPLRPGVGR